jgi:AraC family transcriptional regulator
VVEEILRDQFRAPPSLTALAPIVGVHALHIGRAFRARHGFTVAEYVARVRVEHASRLLAHTRRSVAEIAAEVGFCDQIHLTKAFHRIIGTTPARYRAAYRC